MRVYIHCSLQDADAIEAVKVPSPYALPGSAYVMTSDVTLADYAEAHKRRIKELERRYAYLERGRSWAIQNFRRMVKGGEK